MQDVLNRFSLALNEYLNPMLLRELRQGLRSRVFLGVFLLLQGSMMFSMLLALAASFSPNDRSAMGPANFFFWLTVLLPLLLTLPLKGSVAISGEVKSGTLELLFLTRLSAWHTVMGKWTAIMGQALLVVSALLPYTFMRYYLGGVDILAELGFLLQSVLLCGLLAAMLIAMSAFAGGMVKGTIMLVCLSWALISALSIEEVRDAAITAVTGSWQGPLAAIGVWGLLVFFFLQVGAARIAPPAENYSLRKRLLGLVFLIGLPGLLIALGTPDLVGLIAGLVFAVTLSIEGLLEQTIPLRSMYHRRGLPAGVGALVRYFLSPGWCSGIFYWLLIMAVATWMVWIDVGNVPTLVEPYQRWILLLNISAILIFPNAVAGIFRRKARSSPAFYLTCTLGMIVVAVVSCVLAIVGTEGALKLAACLPHGQPTALILQQGDSPDLADPRLLGVSAGISVLCWLICILRAVQEFRSIADGTVEQAPAEAENEPRELPSMV
jgi:hypothetical protein